MPRLRKKLAEPGTSSAERLGCDSVENASSVHSRRNHNLHERDATFAERKATMRSNDGLSCLTTHCAQSVLKMVQ